MTVVPSRRSVKSSVVFSGTVNELRVMEVHFFALEDQGGRASVKDRDREGRRKETHSSTSSTLLIVAEQRRPRMGAAETRRLEVRRAPTKVRQGEIMTGRLR